MQNFDHNIGFWDKRQFFRQKLSKAQKIVIITSVPGVDISAEKNEWIILSFQSFIGWRPVLLAEAGAVADGSRVTVKATT
jgi:hypothetical protein